VQKWQLRQLFAAASQVDATATQDRQRRVDSTRMLQTALMTAACARPGGLAVA
jgi:hypothetical protein